MRLLYRTSWLILGSVVSALRHGHYDLALLSLASLMTSLMHWKDPVDQGWRQRLDRFTVRSSFVFLSLRIRNQWETIPLPDRHAYIAMVVMGITCYLVSGRLRSTFSHALFHVLANASNMLIFPKLAPYWSVLPGGGGG